MPKPKSHNIYNIPDEQVKMPDESFVVAEPQTKRTSLVVILSALIVLLLLAIGGLVYFARDLLWPTTPEPVTPPAAETATTTPDEQPTSQTVEPVTQQLPPLSTSDDLSALETDLLNTPVTNLGANLPAIDAEFNTN